MMGSGGTHHMRLRLAMVFPSESSIGFSVARPGGFEVCRQGTVNLGGHLENSGLRRVICYRARTVSWATQRLWHVKTSGQKTTGKKKDAKQKATTTDLSTTGTASHFMHTALCGHHM